MDIFATYWQRRTRIDGWDDAGISGGKGGGYGKIGNCSDHLFYLLRVWTGNTWKFCLAYTINNVDMNMKFLARWRVYRVEEFSLVIS